MADTRKLSHSQNFIKRRELVNELLNLTNITADDVVLEIGPGKGIITTQLVRLANKVIAIEKDVSLADRLPDVLRQTEKLHLEIADFLSWPLPDIKYKVFSNIPFNLTADIMRKLTETENSPVDAYLIMQKAAAARFVGKPYGKNTLVALLLKIKFEIQIKRTISEAEFEPRPQVQIVMIHIHKRIKPLIPEKDINQFRDFIVYGYTQWQPTVRDAFKKVFTGKQLAIISQSVPLNLKPTEFNIDQWVSLFNTFLMYASRDGRKLVNGSEVKLLKQQEKLDKQHRTRYR
ncbi:MAG: rRNA adenine N(6)-methyltransferase family protein [Anaerolineae bacterium]|nr:rRNA adenine N(6)-methyltransferase family protein [Anaerolineae bacterium]